MLLGLAAFSTLDGFALIAYSWEQETMYYVRLATAPVAGAALGLSLRLMKSLGPLRTFQMGLCSLCAGLGTMCFAQWHTRLLLVALSCAGGVSLCLLPALRLLATQIAPNQQAAATATILSVATAANALGLGVHAYLFAEAAAHGLLYAPFAVGTIFALIALLSAVACPPPEEAWTSSPHAKPRSQ